jgi:putative oxidoreductase
MSIAITTHSLRVTTRVTEVASRWLSRNSVGLLRLSLGLVFLGFGALKFFPGVSPAEHIAGTTVEMLTFGLVPGRGAVVLVALMETFIGLSLITGRLRRTGLAVLGVALTGILSPLVLMPGQLFEADTFTPNLTGQYVLKDIVLVAAALVVAGKALTPRSAG